MMPHDIVAVFEQGQREVHRWQLEGRERRRNSFRRIDRANPRTGRQHGRGNHFSTANDSLLARRQ